MGSRKGRKVRAKYATYRTGFYAVRPRFTQSLSVFLNYLEL